MNIVHCFTKIATPGSATATTACCLNTYIYLNPHQWKSATKTATAVSTATTAAV